MNPRVNYEMTEEQLAGILDACKPVPCMMIGGVGPSSPQENANRAWARLGGEMGFEAMTVRPVPGMGVRFFTAVPSETPEQRDSRLAREATEKRAAEKARLSTEIAELQRKLDALNG